MLTSFVEHDRVTAALAAGAVGYLLKDSDPRDAAWSEGAPVLPAKGQGEAAYSAGKRT